MEQILDKGISEQLWKKKPISEKKYLLTPPWETSCLHLTNSQLFYVNQVNLSDLKFELATSLLYIFIPLVSLHFFTFLFLWGLLYSMSRKLTNFEMLNDQGWMLKPR